LIDYGTGERGLFLLLCGVFSVPTVKAFIRTIWGTDLVNYTVLGSALMAVLVLLTLPCLRDKGGFPRLRAAGKAQGPSLSVFGAGVCVFFACCVFVARIVHGFGNSYVLFAVSLLVFPLAGLIWTRRGEADVFFRAASRALVVTGLSVVALCVILTPYHFSYMYAGRYQGISSNPNYLGMLMVGGVMGALYIIATSERTSHVAVAAASCCSFMTLLFMSGSRTSQGAVVIQLAMTVFVLARRLRGRGLGGRAFAVRAAAICLAISLCFPVIAVIESAAGGGGGEAPAASASDVLTSPIDRSVSALEEDGGDFLSRFDRLVSGRVPIWSDYFFALKMWGRNPAVYTPVSRSAHSAFLQIAYPCGIPAGIALLVLVVWAFVSGLGMLFTRRGFKPEYLFVAQAAATMLAESLMESAALPYIGSFNPAFYLALGFIIFRRRPAPASSDTTR
jgi:hypothetical protein